MKTFQVWLVFALVSVASVAFADGKFMEGQVRYKIGGDATLFVRPEDACKASVAQLAKSGNKKTFVSVKEGTSSTTMTCVLKESDGKPFDQQNIITKVLECPAGTTAKSTNNSGNFADVKCSCPDKGCPDNKSTVKADVKPEVKPSMEGWLEGTVTYKTGGVDKAFPRAEDACQAQVALLAKSGNKKTFVSVKEGTSSTTMTCVLKESDGKPFEQLNIVTKVLACPAGTSAKSQTNSGNFADVKCKCERACPKK
jgi:hypothetical protein